MSISLAWVNEWTARFPEQRQALIQELIQQRERQLALCQDVHSLTRVQVWSIGRSLLVMTVTVFSLLVTLGVLAEFARIFQGMEEFKITLPSTVLSQSKTLFDFGAHLPASPVLEYAARLPLGDVKRAGIITLGIILTIVVLRSLRVYHVWIRSRASKQMIGELEEEIRVLRDLESGSH